MLIHTLPFPDAKKSVWVPDGEGGYDEAMIDTIEGEKVDLRTFVKLVKLTFFSLGQCESWMGRKDVQDESADASQPSKNGEVRRCLQHDLPQRGLCALESQVEIRLQADLCKFCVKEDTPFTQHPILRLIAACFVW